MTELNENVLNSTPNVWIKQAYVQIFDCKSITFKKDVNMLEHMEIAESTYEGVVEYYDTNSTREDATYDGHIRLKRGESNYSNTYSKMSKSSSNWIKWYVDYHTYEVHICKAQVWAFNNNPLD